MTANRKNSTKSRRIEWLHLSDLHYCSVRSGYDAPRVTETLLRDLEQMEKKYGFKPQLIFFTGDAAFGNLGAAPGKNLRDQFNSVHDFVERVRNAFKRPVPKENVFIIPGNHDVDREEITKPETAWLSSLTEMDPVTTLISGGKKDWLGFMERLKWYRKFLEEKGYQHLLDDADRLIYAQVREFHKLRVGIAGFNTAWSCGPGDAKGKLWFGGDWQLGTLTNKLGKVDFHIGLLHHPFGWFVEQEGTNLEVKFQKEFEVLLHGHEHFDWVQVSKEKRVRIAAAALYQGSQNENGYNFTRLDLDSEHGEVWLRRYEPNGGGWIPRVITERTNIKGVHDLGKLPWIHNETDPIKVRPVVPPQTYGEWLKVIGPLAGNIQAQGNNFLYSLLSSQVRPEKEEKLLNAEIDYLFLYGVKYIMRFVHIRGFSATGGNSLIFSSPVPSSPDGKVEWYNFVQNGGRVTFVGKGGQPLWFEVSNPAVDFLSVAIYYEDIPDNGDWISLESRKHIADDKATLRLGMVSNRKLFDLKAWETSGKSARPERTTFRQSDAAQPYNLKYHISSFYPWLKMLDDLRVGEPGVADVDCRKFLEKCLTEFELEPKRKISGFSEMLAEAALQSGDAREASISSQSLLFTFLF